MVTCQFVARSSGLGWIVAPGDCSGGRRRTPATTGSERRRRPPGRGQTPHLHDRSRYRLPSLPRPPPRSPARTLGAEPTPTSTPQPPDGSIRRVVAWRTPRVAEHVHRPPLRSPTEPHGGVGQPAAAALPHGLRRPRRAVRRLSARRPRAVHGPGCHERDRAPPREAPTVHRPPPAPPGNRSSRQVGLAASTHDSQPPVPGAQGRRDDDDLVTALELADDRRPGRDSRRRRGRPSPTASSSTAIQPTRTRALPTISSR